jgi:RHS repeat-associated protein
MTRTFTTDEAGTIVKVAIAGDTSDPDNNGTFLVTWNGHGDALALWKIDLSTGSLTLANSYAYSTWGQPTVTTHNGIGVLGFRYLYVGRFGVAWDGFAGANLHHMGARHYSPGLGRFLQPDPSALEANLYGYAADSPISTVDPSGHLGCLVPVIGWAVCAAAVRALVWALPRIGLGGLARIGISAGTAIRITGSVSISVQALQKIINRHGSQVSNAYLLSRQTTEPATRFLRNSQIVPLMQRVLTSSSKVCRTEGRTGAFRVCALRFPSPVGVDGNGVAQHWVRVIIGGKGGQVNAYPASQPFRP